MNIYVGNLPYTIADDDLRNLFAPYGKVSSAQVIIDRRSQRSRGYGFVTMESSAEAEQAITALNGSDVQGRALRISRSQPKADNDSRPAKRGSRPSARRRPDDKPATTAAEPEPRRGLFGFFKKLIG